MYIERNRHGFSFRSVMLLLAVETIHDNHTLELIDRTQRYHSNLADHPQGEPPNFRKKIEEKIKWLYGILRSRHCLWSFRMTPTEASSCAGYRTYPHQRRTICLSQQNTPGQELPPHVENQSWLTPTWNPHAPAETSPTMQKTT